MSYYEDFQLDGSEEYNYPHQRPFVENSMKKQRPKKSLFSRGYSEPRERVKKSCGYSMSCFNCEYYFQAVGDKEETCQNNSVLEYDMVVEGHRVYCTHWKMCGGNDKSLFKKSGRSRLD